MSFPVLFGGDTRRSLMEMLMPETKRWSRGESRYREKDLRVFLVLTSILLEMDWTCSTTNSDHPSPKTVQLLALMADSRSPAALIGRTVECRPLLLQNLRVWTTTLVAPTF